ncbi:ABC transporter permease [Rhizobiaceae bacterium BDR2-2]|uniref:ABC transporter permease n=1 Tax=Ectorhizobium quercum TaxID=2965071 RepID=A0AAE3SUQ0_9HYPH|nr:ABC transporter permease [Ectorhizobium quercum]MCX8997475.1 ABC transporter permease [Ectorhizobium quercum]
MTDIRETLPVAALAPFTLPGWLLRIGTALLFPAALVVVWHFASLYRWLPEQILPPPAYVLDAAIAAVREGDLLTHIGWSSSRVALGFVAGATTGLILGFAMGLWRGLDDHIRPLFTAIAQVPTIGWIPLLMLFLGIGEALKIVIIAKAAFIPVVMSTAAALRGVPRAFHEVADVFCLTRAQRLRLLILPAAVAPIFTGIRYGLTKAWTALVAVELLASSEGLGFQLVWARQMFWLDTMIFAMILIGLTGFLMDYALARVELRLQRWRLETAE